MDVGVAVWLAIAVFMVPGFVFSWVAGAKFPAAVAAALPATFGMVGLTSWLLGAMDIRFGWLSFVVIGLLLLAVAGLWRYLFARRHRRISKESWWRSLWPGQWRRGSILDPSWLLPGAGIVAGVWLLISMLLRLQAGVPGQMDNIVQGWDMQWHANSVRFIMETGVASPTRMGELQSPETHTPLFYPSAFHAATALFASAASLEPVAAVNLATIVLYGLALPGGAAGFAWAIARGQGMVAQIATGLAPIAILAAPTVVWVSDFVGMRPYIVSIGLSGIVVALFIQVPRYRALALPTLFAFLGVMQVHPAAVTVVVLAVALYWVTYLVWRPDRSRIGDVFWMAIPAFGATAAFVPQLLAGSSQAEEVQTWDAREDVTTAEAWQKAFMMDTRHVSEFFPDQDPTILLWLAGFGAVAMLVWRGQTWAPIFYGILVAATANALQPLGGVFEPLLTFIGSAHYNSAHRIVTIVALVVYGAAAVGAAVVVRVLCLGPVGKRYGSTPWIWGTTAASAIAAVLLAWGTGAWAVARADSGAKVAFDSSRNDDRMIDRDHLTAFSWLASRPEAREGLVLGESTEGYSWMYAIHGVPTVSRHYLWPSGGIGSNSIMLVDHAALLGTGEHGKPGADNPIDAAAKNIDVRFIISSGNTFWNTPVNWQVHKALWTSPGVTPVYQRHNVTIFAVNSQFSTAELKALQRDAVAKGGSSTLPELEPIQ